MYSSRSCGIEAVNRPKVDWCKEGDAILAVSHASQGPSESASGPRHGVKAH